MSNFNFNLPLLISRWQVSYQPYPLFKKKGYTHFLATDLIENSTSFSDYNLEEYKQKKYNYTLPINVNYNVDEYGEDMLKNHYIHKKKSWSYPNITKIEEYLVYLPYNIEKNHNNIFLQEELSGMKRKLKKKNKLYKILQRSECI